VPVVAGRREAEPTVVLPPPAALFSKTRLAVEQVGIKHLIRLND
jgi:hypothetical protein